jgi:hypothetical protein
VQAQTSANDEHRHEVAVQYVPSFPAAIEPIATALFGALVRPSGPLDAGFAVSVAGEKLSVPYRIRLDPERLRATLSTAAGDVRLLALCLGTRDYDGYVREDCLGKLTGVEYPWVVPFVVALLGDYVNDIAERAAAALEAVNPALLDALARDNPAFVATTQSRAASYWGHYYRQRRYWRCRDYPPYALLQRIVRRVRGSGGSDAASSGAHR